MRPLMKSLGAAAERTGCAVVIIGHLNKGKSKAQYRGLGSIDIYAATRSVLTVGKINSGENTRVVVHNKSNLAPLGASMSFVLDPVFGFSWHGEYDINVDDLFSNAKNSNESQFDRAKRLIENVLRDGAVAAEDIMQMAENERISIKTLKRAKAALNVVSRKRGEQWFWEMAETIYTEFTENQEGQESHTRALTSLPFFNQTEVI
jgi:hypothetical protein